MKQSQDLQHLLDISGVTAVYSYTVPHGTIPLLIVSKKIKRDTLREVYDRSQGCILLTKKDIQDGQDVFALRFLHMKKHARFIGGKDLLKKVTTHQPQARFALESMLRVTLIDLRELLMKEQVTDDMLNMLSLSIDRIGSYSELVAGKQKMWHQHVATCLDICKKSNGDHDDLEVIYHVLEKMTKQVDQL